MPAATPEVVPRLSALQRFILRECYQYPKTRVPRQPFTSFYPPMRSSKTDSVTVSLERLIDRGLLVGFGRRTPRKWFIEQVGLTPVGRSVAKKLFGQQQHLPFN